MRIAQLTLDGYENYGQVLQRYALQRVLKRFTNQVEAVWHQTGKDFLPYDLEKNGFLVGNLRKVSFESIRQNKIKEFNDANICTRFNLPYLEDIADEYDFFVVGSDQVWNPIKYFRGRFLEFAPREKRIAYAASIAVPELPHNIVGYYREKILEMPYVSIREKDGADLVEKITGKRPLIVLDPVFLLKADEWRTIAKPPRWLRKKIYGNGYLLNYFFNGKPPEEVRTLAADLNLPVVNLLDLDNFDHYITGVEEFLYLVDHAKLIFTQSFHGAAFAIIFKRPFIVCRTENEIAGFSRMTSLLELFALSDRATEADLKIKVENPLEIDFARFNEALPIERARAFRFLSEAFGMKPWEKLLGGDSL